MDQRAHERMARLQERNARRREKGKPTWDFHEYPSGYGPGAAAAEEHRSLVKLIDRAVARGALHRNAGARKKSQAARLLSGPQA